MTDFWLGALLALPAFACGGLVATVIGFFRRKRQSPTDLMCNLGRKEAEKGRALFCLWIGQQGAIGAHPKEDGAAALVVALAKMVEEHGVSGAVTLLGNLMKIDKKVHVTETTVP